MPLTPSHNLGIAGCGQAGLTGYLTSLNIRSAWLAVKLSTLALGMALSLGHPRASWRTYRACGSAVIKLKSRRDGCLRRDADAEIDHLLTQRINGVRISAHGCCCGRPMLVVHHPLG